MIIYMQRPKLTALLTLSIAAINRRVITIFMLSELWIQVVDKG